MSARKARAREEEICLREEDHEEEEDMFFFRGRPWLIIVYTDIIPRRMFGKHVFVLKRLCIMTMMLTMEITDYRK